MDKNESGALFLIIHSGSRHLGAEVAAYYQEAACRETPEGIPYEFACASGELMEDYLHDMQLVQHFAEWNRRAIADEIIKGMKLEEQAEQWLRAGCNAGDCLAILSDGSPYDRFGDCKEQAYRETLALAEGGDVFAQCELGRFLLSDHRFWAVSHPAEPEKGIAWLTRAAESGYVHAQCCLADCYWDGEGVEEDYDAAVGWYARAIASGDINAKSRFAARSHYWMEYEKAFPLFAELAEAGNRGAQYDLAKCYLDGTGVTPSKTGGIALLREIVKDEVVGDMAMQLLKECGAESEPPAKPTF